MNTQIFLKKQLNSTFPQSIDFFEVRQSQIPDKNDVKQGQVLVQNIFISVDATNRVWLSGQDTYVKGIKPGDLVTAFCVGKVVFSNSKKFQEGDIIQGMIGWQNYGIFNEKELQKLPKQYPYPSNFLGVLGISGLTAYFGLKDIGNPKKTDTIVVSAAAGAVGEITIQLAKIWGKRVIGIAGGKEKCDYVQKVLGADVCIDYKSTQNLLKDLKQACPEGIDVYFDNVGGDQLDAVLSLINNHARIVLCGAIQTYTQNYKDIYGIKNYSRLITKRGLMKGFLYFDYVKQIPEATQELMKYIEEGKLKFREDIVQGLENAPIGLQKLFTGQNNGKVLISVTNEFKPKL